MKKKVEISEAVESKINVNLIQRGVKLSGKGR